ncbi:uncharacterized protein LOC135212083 [Macrobrachium nipponense]|uniref:uncharacterized protein LOC135212083 n=1 Tax=Macrobrachium nipponense TaxID=159736 RepID=UPI0030C7F67F
MKPDVDDEEKESHLKQENTGPDMERDKSEGSPESEEGKHSPSESPPRKKRLKTFGGSMKDEEKNQYLSEEELERDGDDPDDYIEEIKSSPKKSPSEDEETVDDNSSLHNEQESSKSEEKGLSGKSLAELQKAMKPCTVQIKKLVKTRHEVTVKEGQEEILEKSSDDSHNKGGLSPGKVSRTYPGPTRKVSMFSKPDGRRYMILDRATIKGMMEKGLIQPIEKDGSNQTAAYRAVMPKNKPSILCRVDSPGAPGESPPVAISDKNSESSGSQDSSPFSSAATSASGTSAGSNLKFQVPTSIVVKNASGGLSQVLTTPVFVKTTVSGGGSVSGKYVTLPSALPNQIQKDESSKSLTVTSGSSAPVIVQSLKNTSEGSVAVTLPNDKALSSDQNPDDLDAVPCDSVDMTDSDEDVKKKKFGVPTGVCKVLKSMKMYQYVDKFDTEDSATRNLVAPKNSHNVRWVAVPNNPGDPTPDCGPKIQRCTPPILPISVPEVPDSLENCPLETKNGHISPAEERPASGIDYYDHYKIRELRQKQKDQLMYHRKRYSELLMTYNELASRYDEIKDVGTIRQILTDAKKYMKKDHVLFFRNEMLLKDRSGTGHRYSPKFMLMLMRYYNKSPVGYRFLRQIFTLPAVRTLLNWQNKSLHMRKKKKLLSAQGLALGENDNENSGGSGKNINGETNPVVTPRVPGGINFYDSDSDDGAEIGKVLQEKVYVSKANEESDKDFDGMTSSKNIVFDVPV